LVSSDGEDGIDIEAYSNSDNIAFTGSNEFLLVSDPSNLSGLISGFTVGDTIDLAGIGTATSATLGAGNVLTVQGGTSGPIAINLDPDQSYAGETFETASDNSGGTNVVVVKNDPLLLYLPSDFGTQPPGIDALSGVSISDGDAISANETITISITAPYPLDVTPASGAAVTGANSDSLTLVGDIDAINAELGSLTIDIPDLGYTHQFSIDFEGNDGRGSSLQLACFLAGTQLATSLGSMSVEDLVVSDTVYVKDRTLASVTWIGHRTINCRRHPRPEDVWPVRIAAGAFGDELPIRDLLLSPDHAVYVDDVLIPIKHLINGTTIVQEEVDEVTYYHVELDHHDVILAEGLPCESYLDTGRRSAFANGGAATMLHPEFDLHPDNQLLWESLSYAPLVVTGPVLERVRRKLVAQALRLDRCGFMPSAGFGPAIEASIGAAA
jgi:hypothetical protein